MNNYFSQDPEAQKEVISVAKIEDFLNEAIIDTQEEILNLVSNLVYIEEIEMYNGDCMYLGKGHINKTLFCLLLEKHFGVEATEAEISHGLARCNPDPDKNYSHLIVFVDKPGRGVFKATSFQCD